MPKTRMPKKDLAIKSKKISIKMLNTMRRYP
jgi:hypothetical protein